MIVFKHKGTSLVVGIVIPILLLRMVEDSGFLERSWDFCRDSGAPGQDTGAQRLGGSCVSSGTLGPLFFLLSYRIIVQNLKSDSVCTPMSNGTSDFYDFSQIDLIPVVRGTFFMKVLKTPYVLLLINNITSCHSWCIRNIRCLRVSYSFLFLNVKFQR